LFGGFFMPENLSRFLTLENLKQSRFYALFRPSMLRFYPLNLKKSLYTLPGSTLVLQIIGWRQRRGSAVALAG
jgi:hypothetical protein